MANQFHKLEENLKEFLVDAQSDAHNSRNANFYKYNNLRIYMDIKKYSQPHFIIRIGISEAAYELTNGEKLAGGLNSDEKYIQRWYNKGNVRSELNALWRTSLKVITVQMKDDVE